MGRSVVPLQGEGCGSAAAAAADGRTKPRRFEVPRATVCRQTPGTPWAFERYRVGSNRTPYQPGSFRIAATAAAAGPQPFLNGERCPLATFTDGDDAAAMLRPAFVAAVLNLIGAAAVPCQFETPVAFANRANVDHAAWAEVAVPLEDGLPDRVAFTTAAGRSFYGVKLTDSAVARHFAVLVDLPAGATILGTLTGTDRARDPFTLHPAVDVLQTLPIVVDVTKPDGSVVTLPRVPIDGADLRVIENNEARVVLQARFSDGALHCDAWAYLTSLHPAVRVQVEVHFAALDGRAAETFPATSVRWRWSNTPQPVVVWSDLAALEGWELRGSELRWSPPYRPQEWGPTPADDPAREHVLGWGTRVCFDGMLLFGDDALTGPLRKGARFGPVVGLADAWSGRWGAMGGVPPKPVSRSVDVDWRVPGNVYSRRWGVLNFATNASGYQNGFGDAGGAAVVGISDPTQIRALRLAAVDAALRPGHIRTLDGAPMVWSDWFPQTTTVAGQPFEGFFGIPDQYPRFRDGQSGRRWWDDEHNRTRELPAFLHLSVDYQLRSVLESCWNIGMTQRRLPAGWWGTTRNGGRRLLSQVELGRVLPSLEAGTLDYCQRMADILNGSWVGGDALQANPAARELVIETSNDARAKCDPPHFSPWELTRASSGGWAAARFAADRGRPDLAETWRVRAWQLARTVCMTVVEVDGEPRVPYRLSYAGGVESLPDGWTDPDASTCDIGGSDWFLWSIPALRTFLACPDLITSPADFDLADSVRAALSWRESNRPAANFEQAAWFAPVVPFED